MWETNKHTHTNFRVRLFWVKMISGNHFHHFPHVWLSRKISFSGKWLPVDQYFHLWPENHFLPSFSLQITSGKRERERRESPDQREREKREPRSRRLLVDRTAPTSGAIDEIARCGRRSSLVASRLHRSSLVVDSFSFAGFWFLLPDLMHFL